MRQHHYSYDESNSSLIANVVIETLRHTANNNPVNLAEIARGSKVIPRVAGEVLSDLLDQENLEGSILDLSERFKIGMIAARLGASDRAASALSWQEFELFGAECLDLADFKAQKGVVFKDNKRRWQVDLVGVKGHTLLSIDCKHWESPNYASKFSKAIMHQKESLKPLINHLRASGRIADLEVWGLPVILTLFQPRQSCIDEVVLVSIGQLPDFLSNVTRFDPDLPFVSDGETRKALSAERLC